MRPCCNCVHNKADKKWQVDVLQHVYCELAALWICEQKEYYLWTKKPEPDFLSKEEMEV